VGGWVYRVYAMANISALVNTEWMFGIAFSNNTVEDWANPFEVAQFVEEYLGDHLMGLQVSPPYSLSLSLLSEGRS